MTNLLSADDLAAIKAALKDVVDTFFKQPIIIRHRTNKTTVVQFGERAKHVDQDFPLIGLSEFTRAEGGKYHTVQEDPTGQQQVDGWRFYFWKEDVDALLTVNPEMDKVVMNGKEYIIKFWAPSAWFSDLGELFYELEISKDSAVIPEPVIPHP